MKKFLSPKLKLYRQDGGFFECDPDPLQGFFLCYRTSQEIWEFSEAVQFAQLELSNERMEGAYKFIRVGKLQVSLKELNKAPLVDPSIGDGMNEIGIRIGDPVWAQLWIWE